MIRASLFLVLLMSMNCKTNEFVSKLVCPVVNTLAFGLGQVAFRQKNLQERHPSREISLNELLPDLLVGTAAGAVYAIGPKKIYESTIKPTLQYFGVIVNDRVIH